MLVAAHCPHKLAQVECISVAAGAPYNSRIFPEPGLVDASENFHYFESPTRVVDRQGNGQNDSGECTDSSTTLAGVLPIFTLIELLYRSA